MMRQRDCFSRDKTLWSDECRQRRKELREYMVSM
jgi:hypothetical protein